MRRDTKAMSSRWAGTRAARRGRRGGGRPAGRSGRTWTYSAGNQSAADSNIAWGTMSALAARGITLPPESMVIPEAR